MNTRTVRPLISIAVYGTLRRGLWNHQYYCAGAVSIDEGFVRGRLYELPSGIPVLQVPDDDILAEGTHDPLADVATQERLAQELIWPPDRESGDWDLVHCELMTFDDPEARLSRIDCLEGFRPGRMSLYRRVLVPIFVERGRRVPAWCYVVGKRIDLRGLPSGRTSWPQ